MDAPRTALALTCALLFPQVGRAAEVKHIVVLPFSVAKGVDASTGKLLDDIVLNELSERAPEGIRIIGSSDVIAMLGIEQQKQMINCDDTSCMAEIGSALGATHIWVPSIGKLGSKFVISTKFMDVIDARVVLRKVIYVGANEDELLGGIRSMVDLLGKKLGWDGASASTRAKAMEPVPAKSDGSSPRDTAAVAAVGPADPQAGQFSTAEDPAIDPLVLSGSAVAGLGLAAAGGLGAWALFSSGEYKNLKVSGDDRLAARDTARVTGAFSVASLGLIALGGVLVVLGLL